MSDPGWARIASFRTVEAFRTQVLKMFSDSKFAANWPKGLLERINQAGM
jgi:hypothetical protein